MKVGIDVTSLIYGRGVSRYTANLVTALATKPEVSLSLYGASWRQQAWLQQQALKLVPQSRHNVTIQKIPPTGQNILWNWLQLNPISKVFPHLDVFHSWDWLQPPDKNLPLVSTIHDLAILKYPETAHPQVVKMHQNSWERLKHQRAHIIAVSHATRKDVIEHLQYPPELVHTIYEALPLEVKQVSEQLSEEHWDQLKQQLQLHQPYLLFVGTREPRKNLLRLIQAWQPLAHQVQLIIAGEKGWDETASPGLLQHPNLRFLGKVTDQQLAVLYGEAEALVYPCLYEGFGLPILEAFYHGIPVITSNVSAMVEVAGNAAELVDPLEVESIRRGIANVLSENTTEQQKRLQRMIIRLHLFSWQRVADETIQVYRLATEGEG